MNEIIGPIYYVVSSDPDLEWSKYAEHDTFYCFTRVMSEIRDNFIQSMDESTSGIHANMSKGKFYFLRVAPSLIRKNVLVLSDRVGSDKFVGIDKTAEFGLVWQTEPF